MANVSGTVNVNAVGEYTLTYQVSDAAGNQSNPVVRKITVVMPVLGNLINGDFSMVYKVILHGLMLVTTVMQQHIML